MPRHATLRQVTATRLSNGSTWGLWREEGEGGGITGLLFKILWGAADGRQMAGR